MAEKKTTKKPTAKVEEKIEEVKIPVASVTIDPEELLADKEIAKEMELSLKEASGKDRYFEAIGRRKTAVARVRLYTKGDKEFLVNDESYQKYFDIKGDQETAVASMNKMKCLDKFRVTVVVRGGGHSAQAEAIRHGTARVLVDFNNNFRKRLRKAGFLTRDPRMRERKKFGLKRARKGPQWSKR
jgi:small subunit ribosomal protein S9